MRYAILGGENAPRQSHRAWKQVILWFALFGVVGVFTAMWDTQSYLREAAQLESEKVRKVLATEAAILSREMPLARKCAVASAAIRSQPASQQACLISALEGLHHPLSVATAARAAHDWLLSNPQDDAVAAASLEAIQRAREHLMATAPILLPVFAAIRREHDNSYIARWLQLPSVDDTSSIQQARALDELEFAVRQPKVAAEQAKFAHELVQASARRRPEH